MNYATDERLDCLIRLALMERIEKDEDVIKAMDTSGVVCPTKVDKRVHRMIARKARETVAGKSKRVLFRVMVAAVIVLSLTLTLLMSVSGVREAIRRAVIEWFDDYIAVSFHQEQETPADQGPSSAQNEQGTPNTPPNEGETESTPSDTPPSEILEYKLPSNLPSGYEGEEALKDITQYIVDYYYMDEWSFSFIQMILTDSEKWIDDIDTEEAKQLDINGMEAILLLSVEESENTIVWQDGLYSYNISGFLTEEELITFAKSVK